MRTITRRAFVLASAALPLGCAADRPGAVPGAPAPDVRQPATGQTWRYTKHDMFTGALVDNEVDQVAAVNHVIDVSSRTERGDGTEAPPSATGGWWRKYFEHPKSAALPSEIQSPWGMVLVDPHWGQAQVYDAAIPLWPTVLQPGWRTRFKSTYKISEAGAALYWDQSMKAEAWETVSVPAGQFKALRYINLIHFASSDAGRTDSVRRETVWFAPEVGRWVARESRGSYYLDDSVDDTQAVENAYRWALLSWS